MNLPASTKINTTDQFQSIYFIGIKGVGMSALALVAKGFGYQVSGSDVAEEFITDSVLNQAGIEIKSGFQGDHLNFNPDLVVVGAAFGEDNVEVKTAIDRELVIWTYSELLGYLSRKQKTLAVAGTHGKTTTSAILAFLLVKNGFDPSYIIGTGHVGGLPAHGQAGQGEYFVTEADDYRRSATDNQAKFLDLSPYAAIITSIEHDHPDIYPTLADCLNIFAQFVQKVNPKGFLIVNGDDRQILQLRKSQPDRQFITVGFQPTNQYRIVELANPDESDLVNFQIHQNKTTVGNFKTQLKGKHNQYNAAMAVVLALKLGLTASKIKESLLSFQSIERRYELIGQKERKIVIDDYAHHPTAIKYTLETAKKQYPHLPIWCIFQAHTFSRTKVLLTEFGTAFSRADVLLVTDIFSSARERDKVITVEQFVQEIAKSHPNVRYVPRNQVVNYLHKFAPTEAVVITMGAGDIYKAGREYFGGLGE